MSEHRNYWTRTTAGRRRFIQGGVLSSGGLLFLAACGGGSSNSNNSANNSTNTGNAGTSGSVPTPALRPSVAASAGSLTATPGAAGLPAAPTPDLASAKRGGTLNTYWTVADAQLDPHTSTEHFGAELWRAASHGLMKAQPLSQIAVPDLANSFEITDPLTYVFHLPPEAKWQMKDPVNGRPVVADDVVYSLKRVSTPDAAHPRASGFTAVDSFTATDDHTLVMKLKQPIVTILAALAGKWTVIVPHEVVEKYGDLKQGNTMIGCGPFLCDQADSSKGATLTRNPNYWRNGPDGKPLPYLDKVVYTTITDTSAQQAAFRSGQVDLLGGLTDQTKDSYKASDVNINGYPLTDLTVSVIGGPNDKPPFNDPRVRQAVNIGLDRDQIALAAFPGVVYQPAGVLETIFWGVPTDQVVKVPGFGKQTDALVQQAKQLLSAAGAAGTDLSIITTTSYHQYYSDRATAIQPMLEKIGFKVKLDQVEYAVFKDRESKKNYQMECSAFAADGDPDAQFNNLFSTTGTRNYWTFSDPAYDAMVAAEQKETDFDKRRQIMIDMQLYLMKGTPVAHNQWYSQAYVAIRKKVHNYFGAVSSTSGWFLPTMWVDA